MMKKKLVIAATLLISWSAVSMNVFAAETDSATVYVTISDKNKEFALIEEPINVTDIDSDGKLTINDALYIAHDSKYNGGAAAGYKSSIGQYGLQLDKLWGEENGGSYGYYVNDNMSMGLADEIKSDDQIQAFVYSDTKTFSDSYSFFNAKNGEDSAKDSEISLDLSYVVFDENYSPVNKKLVGAKITINGQETSFVTDNDGKVTVKLTDEGKNVLSATSESVNIVPPVYVVNVSGEAVTTSTTTASTTTTTTTTTTSTKAATTATNTSNSPKTGVKGAGIAVAGLFTAIATSFALRRRDED